MNLGIENRRVFITGSSRGIGLATAECFLKEGALVILNGRNQARLERATQELSHKYGDRVSYIVADILTEKGVQQIVQNLEKKYHGLDILVGNLGNGKRERNDELDLSEWIRFYDINVLGNLRVISALYELLKLGVNPNIVLISSVIAKEAANAPAGYAAAKSAVRTLSKYLSRIGANDGIRVNCVLPGNIYFKGGRWEELLKVDRESTMQYIQTSVPMKRFGEPIEIASMIAFLASDRATFVTGTEISVDGGQLAAI